MPSALFAGPKPVLAYLSRYTHRVAISNSRLIKAAATSVTFKVKNYRADGPARYTARKPSLRQPVRRTQHHHCVARPPNNGKSAAPQPRAQQQRLQSPSKSLCQSAKSPPRHRSPAAAQFTTAKSP
jgi:hypothetical protein